jgi:hypothetical protein
MAVYRDNFLQQIRAAAQRNILGLSKNKIKFAPHNKTEVFSGGIACR